MFGNQGIVPTTFHYIQRISTRYGAMGSDRSVRKERNPGNTIGTSYVKVIKIRSEVKDVAITRLGSPANSNEKQVGNFFDSSSQ